MMLSNIANSATVQINAEDSLAQDNSSAVAFAESSNIVLGAESSTVDINSGDVVGAVSDFAVGNIVLGAETSTVDINSGDVVGAVSNFAVGNIVLGAESSTVDINSGDVVEDSSNLELSGSNESAEIGVISGYGTIVFTADVSLNSIIPAPENRVNLVVRSDATLTLLDGDYSGIADISVEDGGRLIYQGSDRSFLDRFADLLSDNTEDTITLEVIEESPVIGDVENPDNVAE